jgi:plasmid stabilization system protein ParE
MGHIIWTYFAILELKNIYLYYKLVASEAIAKKIKKSLLDSTKTLSKKPHIGQIEENLIELKQKHRYILNGNYKIIYFISNKDIYMTDIFDCRQNPQKIKLLSSSK